MTKTKIKDEVMSDFYWTTKERENLNFRYSTNLLKENCAEEDLNDKTLPIDAYVVTYKMDGIIRKDLVRCHGQVNIFDMYYDKFGSESLVSIEYGPGMMNPKLWGIPAPSKPKKKRRGGA